MLAAAATTHLDDCCTTLLYNINKLIVQPVIAILQHFSNRFAIYCAVVYVGVLCAAVVAPDNDVADFCYVHTSTLGNLFTA